MCKGSGIRERAGLENQALEKSPDQPKNLGGIIAKLEESTKNFKIGAWEDRTVGSFGEKPHRKLQRKQTRGGKPGGRKEDS